VTSGKRVGRGTPGRARPRRLQLRVSLDEHMGDLFSWLEGLPSNLRGRELVALARLARGLNTLGGAVAALRAGQSWSAEGAALPESAGAPAAASSPPSGTPAADLSDQAANLAASTFDANFLMAAPPRQSEPKQF
jgi:hypothetical protein